MNRTVKRAIEILLMAGIISLIIISILPVKETRLPDVNVIENSINTGIAGKDEETLLVMKTSEIAYLFGWRRPAAVVSVPSVVGEAPKPEQMPTLWIKYIGYFAGQDEKVYYYFKNDRTGRVVKVTPGEEIEGWALLKWEDGIYYLEKERMLYLVKER